MDRFTVLILVYACTIVVLSALLALVIVTQAVARRVRNRRSRRHVTRKAASVAEGSGAAAETAGVRDRPYQEVTS